MYVHLCIHVMTCEKKLFSCLVVLLYVVLNGHREESRSDGSCERCAWRLLNDGWEEVLSYGLQHAQSNWSCNVRGHGVCSGALRLHAASQNPGWVARHVTLQFFNRMGHLVVVEVVNEGGEAPGLVLQGQRQDRNVANEYRVKEPRHFQVVAGTQRLRKQASVLQELLNDSGTSQNGG